MHIMWCILIEFLHKLNINKIEVLPILALDGPTWMDNIVAYLLHNDLLEDKVEKQKLRYMVVN